MRRKLGRVTARTSDQNLPKRYPMHMASLSVRDLGKSRSVAAAQDLAGHGSSGGEFSSQKFSRQCTCIVHHLFCSISANVHIIFPSRFYIIKLSLSHPEDFTLLLLLSPFSTLSYLGAEVSE